MTFSRVAFCVDDLVVNWHAPDTNPQYLSHLQTREQYRCKGGAVATSCLFVDMELRAAERPLFLLLLFHRLVDVHPFRDDATMNLCHGLILHQLWHERAVVDVEKLFIEDIGTKPGNSSQDYEEGCGENDTMEVKEKMEHRSIDVAGTSSPSNWLLEQQRDFELRENLAALDISGNSCGSTQGLQQQGLYEGDEHEHQHNNSWQTAAVLWSPGT
jgi:hypothetical protein